MNSSQNITAMFERIIKIGTITGSNNLIINGDLVFNENILSTVANHLLQSELERLSKEAREQMEAVIATCVKEVLDQVLEKNLESKLVEFAHPSVQWAFYNVLKGYTMAETQEQREMIVDSMIERMYENWDSTEKTIIDAAIDVIPKLSPSTLSLLGLLQLRHQITNASIGLMLNQYFESLSPLVERVAEVGALEIEYLRQEKLIIPLYGLRTALSLEKILLANYDLFFRKSLAPGEFEAYCKLHPEAHEAVTDEPINACMMWINMTEGGNTAFCCPNSRVLKQSLAKRHQEYIIPFVDELMGMMPVFTEVELREYFFKISPSWEKVFSLFSSEEIKNNILSITGNYLGGKILAKTGRGKPLRLSDYNNIYLAQK